MSKSHLALALLAASLSAGCQQAQTSATTENSTQAQAPATTPAPAAAAAALPGAPVGDAQVHKLASGLQYYDLSVGNGTMAEPGMKANVRYSGTLTDGTPVDSGVYEFQLGASQVIAGWDEGIKGMRLGGKRKLVIPPDMAYGPQGSGSRVPPNSTLVFDVELLGVK